METPPGFKGNIGEKSQEMIALEREAERQEKLHSSFEDFWYSKINAFELIGKIDGREKACSSLQDFEEDKRWFIFMRALELEFVKLIGRLPEIKLLSGDLQAFKISSRAWLQYLPDQQRVRGKNDLDFYLGNFGAVLEGFGKRDFKLPSSADGFELWHERLGKSRQIPSFIQLLQKKLKDEFEKIMVQEVEESDSFTHPILDSQFLDEVVGFFKLYRDVAKRDVPLYKKALEKIQVLMPAQQKVFYGRDAEYLYEAFKALRFGLIGRKNAKLVYINSDMRDVLNRKDYDRDENLRDRIMAYLLQEQIQPDAVHVDTGYKGSVPEAVIRALNPDLPAAEINKRIKLLESEHAERASLIKGGSISYIEDRAHRHARNMAIEKDSKTGRLKVVSSGYKDYNEQFFDSIRVWVIEQAVLRSLLPRRSGKWSRRISLLKNRAQQSALKRIFS